MSDETGLDLVQEQETSVAMEAEKSRAVQKIQSALAIAKRFPRDTVRAVERITVECGRKALAEKARYMYPRGGEKVTGPTIRLAEVLARHWGNLTFGFRVLEQKESESTVETFCWDLETNTQVTREFVVSHSLRLKDGKMKYLKDPRDIYEMVANQAQRRVRACILEVIPGDIVDKSLAVCAQTLLKDSSEPLVDRITRIVVNFSKMGVTKELIEQKIGHKCEEITPEELIDLGDIYNSMKEGASKRSDWFKVGDPVEGGKAAELADKLQKKREAEKPADPELLPFEKEPKK